MSSHQSNISTSTTTYPFYMGLISRSNKTSPILSFLEKKIEIEKSKISKESLDEWFPPNPQSVSYKVETKLESSDMNLNTSVDDYDKSDIPYDGYLGLEEKKPARYLKLKTIEKIPYEFRIGLGELLPPKTNKLDELHCLLLCQVLPKTSRELLKLQSPMPPMKRNGQVKTLDLSRKLPSKFNHKKGEKNALLKNSKSSIPKLHQK
ncbi:9180_t:CDS:2 [Ambispora gerdemannii]|uniref:9180_t:CDS:1 n=1 Tax=Ambispora gerdemannii TaxID=144530 RepID=A0A9N8ZFQ3_9GLOM|nr:9180_t:CDS:2 [Ambispora gerdemannii]